jgi:hypothetical protein
LIRETEGLAMKKTNRQQPAQKNKGKTSRTGTAKRRRPCTEADLISALNHPLRRQILRLMHSTQDPLSPSGIEAELALGDEPGAKLSSISYHTSVLGRLNAIAMVGQRQVRGAMEHFHASQVADTAWVRGLLSRTRESDEAQLWPEGRGRPRRKAARKSRP